MAKVRKPRYGNDTMAVSSFVSEGIRVFTNATTLAGEALYSWEIVDHCTDEVVFKQPFTTNPVFAYSVEKFKNMDVVARIKGDVELSCKVFEIEQRDLPEIKMMYARRCAFYRFTNITDVENVSYCWRVEERVKRHWEEVCSVADCESNVFEYTFEKGKDYRVTASICSDDGGCSTRVVAEITACDLELPRVI